jgi:hypothetical protein
MVKYTTIIFKKEKKDKFNEFKRAYMLENKLFKLSDADYCMALITLHESKKYTM